jgi:methyl-accepting chemotaxis protein
LLALAKSIERVIGEVDGLTRFANVLAINAKIEAVRMSEQGASFEVIADSLRDFGAKIQTACGRVNSSIAEVRDGVPPVSARAASMQERARQFISEVAQQVEEWTLETDANAADGGGLASVIELSNQALSHLQFQDPMSQKLGSIDVGLDGLQQRVSRLLHGERKAAEPDGLSTETPLRADLNGQTEIGAEPAPGEMVLF